MYTVVLCGFLKERDHLEHLCTEWKIIIKLILEKDDGWAWAGLLWLRVVTSDCCREGNEPSGS